LDDLRFRFASGSSIKKYSDIYFHLTRYLFVGMKNNNSIDMKEVEAMRRKTHPFSFLSQYPIFFLDTEEEEIFLEYSIALSKGWMIQAIISHYPSDDDTVLNATAQDIADLSILISSREYTYYYPIVFLCLEDIIDFKTAKKIIKKLTPSFTNYTNVNDKSFEKHFDKLSEILKRIDFQKIVENNLQFFLIIHLLKDNYFSKNFSLQFPNIGL
jgi:hypothetical protein